MIQLPLAKSISRVLCLGAHSDDIEIGAGATILRLAEENPGLEFLWVVFGGNDIRQKEARDSAELMLSGISKKRIMTHAFRDARFPSQHEEIKDVFEGLKDFNPDLIFTQYRDDAHQDHRTLNQLTWNTFRSHLVLEYEILKYDGDLGRPNVFAPVSERHAQMKIDHLMKCFASQRNKQWYDDVTFRSMLRIRGVECNSPTRYAEAFYGRKICF